MVITFYPKYQRLLERKTKEVTIIKSNKSPKNPGECKKTQKFI